MIISFFVPGRPQTAGSKTAVPMGARMGVIEAGSKESRLRKKTWRGDLRDGALEALAGAGEHGAFALKPFDGPLELTVVIIRKRPSAHISSRRNLRTVKEWAELLLPVQRPDTLKIVRAAEDALTGVLWLDDSQIVRHHLHKAYADQVGLPNGLDGLYIVVDEVAGYSGPQLNLEAADWHEIETTLGGQAVA